MSDDVTTGGTEAEPAGREAMASKASLGPSRPRKTTSGYRRWETLFNGRIYRPVMRLMHRLGWCYPAPTLMGDGSVWCHWCGMRGKAALTPENERLMRAALSDSTPAARQGDP